MIAGECYGMLKVTPERFRENRRTYFIVLCCCGNSVNETLSSTLRKGYLRPDGVFVKEVE